MTLKKLTGHYHYHLTTNKTNPTQSVQGRTSETAIEKRTQVWFLQSNSQTLGTKSTTQQFCS